ncbi:Gfo/Idh/MocA family protein [Radicibacter daui]|uniref:Gfo/Idh/MocA family protein n=1 Tax=Radicibacter daui TaxID=3064829 RepID=UPI004046ADAF
MSSVRFVAVGINHDHINGQIKALTNAGAELAGFYAEEDDLAAAFMGRYAGVPRLDDPRRAYDDKSVGLVISAGISARRAGIAIDAMRAGKDVMLDKPGMTSLEQLAAVKAAQQETGRILSIMYSEHFEVGATVKAGELIAAGAIGEVVNIVGLGPHRLRKAERPGWFFNRAEYGGILCDIASHQVEQFLFFTGAEDADILSASVANIANPDKPELQDVGDMHLRALKGGKPGASGYIRVDWMTPQGLPVWGDGRLTIIGTEGYIELRKYIDIAGKPGTDHLFLADAKGLQHIDASKTPLPYGPQLLADIRDRTETAMPQWRCFKAMEISLKAQAHAEAAAATARKVA